MAMSPQLTQEKRAVSHTVPMEEAQIHLGLAPEAEIESRLSLGNPAGAQPSQFRFRSQDSLHSPSGQSQGPSLGVVLLELGHEDALQGAEPGLERLFSRHGLVSRRGQVSQRRRPRAPQRHRPLNTCTTLSDSQEEADGDRGTGPDILRTGPSSSPHQTHPSCSGLLHKLLHAYFSAFNHPPSSPCSWTRKQSRKLMPPPKNTSRKRNLRAARKMRVKVVADDPRHLREEADQIAGKDAGGGSGLKGDVVFHLRGEPGLRQEFLSALPWCVNTRDCQKLSSYLLLEETAAGTVVFGEKMYTLVSPTGECFKTRMKGVAYHNLRNLTLDQSQEIIQSGAVLESSRRAFKRVHAGPINMISDTKRFKLAIHQRKRNFTQDGHSFPRC